MGLWAGCSLGRELLGLECTAPSGAIGGLIRHLVQSSAEDFQPSNINWGLIPTPEDLRHLRRRKERREATAQFYLEELRLRRDRGEI